MVKKRKTTVWLVKLPGGRTQEIDQSVVQKYFLDDSPNTPFSHYTLEKAVRLRPVVIPRPAAPVVETPAPAKTRKRVKIRPKVSRRPAVRAGRLARLRSLVRSSRAAAARRLRKR